MHQCLIRNNPLQIWGRSTALYIKVLRVNFLVYLECVICIYISYALRVSVIHDVIDMQCK